VDPGIQWDPLRFIGILGSAFTSLQPVIVGEENVNIRIRNSDDDDILQNVVTDVVLTNG
jgi:hypothetical protein